MTIDTEPSENGASFPDHQKIHDLIKRAIPVLAIFCLILYVAKLVASLHEVYFWSDECVHAYVGSVISKTHSLPWVLPDEIYGNWRWSYPPLFHILAAFVLGVAGKSALPYVNITLLAFFLVCFLILLWKYYGRNEALIASLLLILSPVVAINSIRFMTEMLSMTLTFFSFFFLLVSLKNRSLHFAVLSGVATAALLLCKQIGVVVLGFYGMLLLWTLIRKKIDFKPVLIVLVVSGAIYLPYLIIALTNQTNPLEFLVWFSKKSELAGQAIRSFRHRNSSLEEFLRLFFKGNGVILTSALFVPLEFFGARIKRLKHEHYIFFLLIFLSLAMVAWHITNIRHTITLIPALTFLVAYSVCRMVRNSSVLTAVMIALILFSFHSTLQMENYRELCNGPSEIKKMMEAINNSAGVGRVFGIHAFGVLWHTERPVIWVYPNLENVPIELVNEENADRFYALLKIYKIELILLDRPYIRPGEVCFGRSYTGIFSDNCEKLKASGKIVEIHESGDERYILFKVI